MASPLTLLSSTGLPGVPPAEPTAVPVAPDGISGSEDFLLLLTEGLSFLGVPPTGANGDSGAGGEATALDTQDSEQTFNGSLRRRSSSRGGEQEELNQAAAIMPWLMPTAVPANDVVLTLSLPTATTPTPEAVTNLASAPEDGGPQALPVSSSEVPELPEAPTDLAIVAASVTTPVLADSTPVHPKDVPARLPAIPALATAAAQPEATVAVLPAPEQPAPVAAFSGAVSITPKTPEHAAVQELRQPLSARAEQPRNAVTLAPAAPQAAAASQDLKPAVDPTPRPVTRQAPTPAAANTTVTVAAQPATREMQRPARLEPTPATLPTKASDTRAATPAAVVQAVPAEKQSDDNSSSNQHSAPRQEARPQAEHNTPAEPAPATAPFSATPSEQPAASRPAQLEPVRAVAPEHLIETPGTTSTAPLKDLSLRVQAESGSAVDLRFIDRGSEVTVTVRAQNPAVAERLAADLPVLEQRFDTQGLQSSFRPASTLEAEPVRQPASQSASNSSRPEVAAASETSNGQQAGMQQQRGQGQHAQPDVDDLQNAIALRRLRKARENS